MAASTAGGGAFVAHHFDNLRQQQATVRFGMWLFLVTEVLFFGGAFCAYTAYRIWFPREFEAGSAVLNVGIAGTNAFLLLTSSLTMTLGIRAAYAGNKSALQMWLGVTIILGTVFLGLKMREYQIDFQEGLLPSSGVKGFVGVGQLQGEQQTGFVEHLKEALDKAGYKYTPSGAGGTLAELDEAERLRSQGVPEVDLYKVQLFFLFYYILTGLHVVHMVVGIGLLGWQFTLAKVGFFDHPSRYVYIEVMSLYWHFVDMVWVFLLPLLYLAGPHSSGQALGQLQHALGLH